MSDLSMRVAALEDDKEAAENEADDLRNDLGDAEAMIIALKNRLRALGEKVD